MTLKSTNETNKTSARILSSLRQTYFIIRWSLPIILLGMILARLVWMQQRQYSISNRVPALSSQIALSAAHPSDCAIGPRSEIFYPFERLSQDLKPVLGFAAWSASGPLSRTYFRTMCDDGTLAPLDVIRMNQWLWVTVVFLSSLALRFVSRSWVLPLVAATALMSRGDLMTQIGNISGSELEMLCCSLWFCCMVHFMRSGSWLTYVLGSGAAAVGAFFSPVLGFLLLAMPIMLVAGRLGTRLLGSVVMENLRRERRRVKEAAARRTAIARDDDSVAMLVGYARRVLGLAVSDSSHQPSASIRPSPLFSTTDVPFAVWAYQSERWARIALIGSVLFLLVMLCQAGQMIWAYPGVVAATPLSVTASTEEALRRLSFSAFFNNIDFHYLISCVVLVASAVQSPADGLVCFFESVWLLIFSVVIMMFGALAMVWFCAGTSPFGQLNTAQFMTVIGEPLKYIFISMEGLIISFGIGGIYNLIKATDSLLFQKTTSTK